MKEYNLVTILSIDGGGVKGLLPARILEEIRKRLDTVGEKRRFFELFDLIAGTSTGAIIALGLSLKNPAGGDKFSASEIVDMYKTRGKEIFPHSNLNAVHTAVQAFRFKHPAVSFEKLLMEFFGDNTLKDAETNLLITSFDTEAMEPHCMKLRPQIGDWVNDYNYYMRDAARASGAAPTYFPPAQISPVGKKQLKFSLVDGAVFANNPSGLAYIEASRIFPKETEFLILSLGTGNSRHGYLYQDVHSWGFMEWINPIKEFPIGAMMSSGQSEAVNHQLKRLDNVHYIRLNTMLTGEIRSMDDSSNTNMKRLSSSADKMIEEFSDQIDEVCHLLSSQ